MNSLFKLFRFDFLPTSADFGLLVLRVWFGGSMLWLHGWPRIQAFSDAKDKFPINLFGLGSAFSFGLCTFAESFCALLVMLGFLTRFGALVSAINMGVAWYLAHKLQLRGPNSGELAFLYLAVFVVLFFAGGGRFGFDQAKASPRRRSSRPPKD